jgi:sulfoxide reductase heme-binding subunit YedZ
MRGTPVRPELVEGQLAQIGRGFDRLSPSGAGARRRKPLLLRPVAKPVLFIACLLPFAWLLYGALSSIYGVNTLGANPAETLIRATGDWTLRFLCITLSVTPLRQWFKQPALARFRRMLGLFTFFYGCVHFLCYSWLDMGLVLGDIVRDIPKRPFILVGTSALLLMTPLALTSFNRAIKALGAARWQALHRAVYAVALLAILHFFWMRAAKHNFAEVAVYAAIIGVLLGWRLWTRLRARAQPAISSASTP